MKRFLLILLALALALTLCFCGGENKEDTKKTEGTVAVNSTEKVEPAVTASTAEKVETSQSESSTTTDSQTTSSVTNDAATPTSILMVGSTVIFGHYEQDNYTHNGAEPIEWIVLDVQDDKALLISKYGLDAVPYNEVRKDVTWETCTLRTWLKNEFYNAAFSQQEQSRISTTLVTDEKNIFFNTVTGNATNDKVFLLSRAEANKYFATNEMRSCAVTQLAKANGAFTYDKYTVDGMETCYWWLRSPGEQQNSAIRIDYEGWINNSGYYVDSRGYCIRPAIWVYLSDNTELTSIETTDSEYNVGDIVLFGNYEQDDDPSDGAEPIEWIILDSNYNGEYLLLSRYGLDTVPYNNEKANITWEKSTIRKWLNGEFYDKVFTESAKSQIVTTYVTADKNPNPRCNTDPGIATNDKVFLLSITEVNGYFDNDEARKCMVASTSSTGNSSAAEYRSLCMWWLRTPGVTQNHATGVGSEGRIDEGGFTVNINNAYARPAVWVRISENSEIKKADKPDISTDPGADPLTDLAENDNDTSKYKVGDIVIFGHYEQDNDKSNGGEPIEWIVLDKKDNEEYLLLSKYALDYKPYNTIHGDITWSECTLRTWLNDEFYNAAFSVSEQDQILMTEVDNSQNQCYSDWNTSGGNNTQDKVFLLSYAEANKYLNVTPSDSNNVKSRTSPTAYADPHWVSSYKTSEGAAACYWWLRSPGSYQTLAALVDCDGSLPSLDVYDAYNGVRPAIWVRFSE